ncbi:hypothetical protein C8J56DRAFT_851171 [Mycena floridula]|nr:hypothetical protein C8J56DRAFT_851171 [Mycena floridula]
MAAHPRTPLRRVSQGSLFAISRSGVFPDAPHGLGFLEPALTEFADETDTLLVNVEAMSNLADSLSKFNESFASWLYIMNMNALTTDWPQAPTDASFVIARKRAEEATAAIQAEAERRLQAQIILDKTAATEAETETTYATADSGTAAGPPKKKKAKGKQMTAKEKKERSIEIEKIIAGLPLEFRGSDPNLHRNMESVIQNLMDAPNQTARITDLIKPPDLPQARVNKCLIALVNRKVVQKESSTGVVLYHWRG